MVTDARYVEGSLARALPRVESKPRARAKAKQRRPIAAIAIVAVIAVALGLAFLAQFAAKARLVYQNDSLNEQINRLARENSELELKIEELSSLERIETVATKKLGMLKPDASTMWEPADQ